MTSRGSKSMTMAEFERLLDVYGGERARWPAEARAAAAQLVAADPGARRLLVETEALDRVLERAPLPSLAIEAGLAERIVTAAQRSPRIVPLPGVHRPAVAAEAAHGEGALPAAPASGPFRRRSRWLSREVGAAGLLAASLAMGVVIGNYSSLPLALAEMTGLGPDRDSLGRIALYDPQEEV